MMIYNDYRFKNKENEKLANAICELANSFDELYRASVNLKSINKFNCIFDATLENIYQLYVFYCDELFKKEKCNLAFIFDDESIYILKNERNKYEIKK